MKIYLASYLEKENHGSGKKYSVVATKPDGMFTNAFYSHLTPKNEIMEDYYNTQLKDQVSAAINFNNEFRKQLDEFVNDVKKTSEDEKVEICELIPFRDGDTLLSWEREGYTNYRYLIAEALEKLGYEVNLR